MVRVGLFRYTLKKTIFGHYKQTRQVYLCVYRFHGYTLKTNQYSNHEVYISMKDTKKYQM